MIEFSFLVTFKNYIEINKYTVYISKLMYDIFTFQCIFCHIYTHLVTITRKETRSKHENKLNISGKRV